MAFFASIARQQLGGALQRAAVDRKQELAGLHPGGGGRAARHDPQDRHPLVVQRVDRDQAGPGPEHCGPLVDRRGEEQVGGRLGEGDGPGVGDGVAGRQQVKQRGALQALLGQHCDQEALHLQRRRQLLGHPADDVRIAASARDQLLERHALGRQQAVDHLPRRRHEVQALDLVEVLDQLLLDLAHEPLPRGALGDHAEEGQAGPDRAVEAHRLVAAHDHVLDELAGRVLDLEPVLPGADTLQLARRLSHRLAVEEDQRAGRLEVSCNDPTESSSLIGGES